MQRELLCKAIAEILVRGRFVDTLRKQDATSEFKDLSDEQIAAKASEELCTDEMLNYMNNNLAYLPVVQANLNGMFFGWRIPADYAEWQAKSWVTIDKMVPLVHDIPAVQVGSAVPDGEIIDIKALAGDGYAICIDEQGEVVVLHENRYYVGAISEYKEDFINKDRIRFFQPFDGKSSLPSSCFNMMFLEKFFPKKYECIRTIEF